MKRLFIAINLPQEVKGRIEKVVSDLKISVNQRVNQHESAAEIRFLPKENWHLTLVFLGYQPDEAISPILNSLKETVKNSLTPFIEFEKIILAPPNRPARMIWLVSPKETSKTLGAIKTKLEDELVKNGVRFQRENREYNTHLTLVRFRFPQGTLRRVMCENLKISFEAQSLDLMESHLKRSGAEYEILTRVDFI
jgi:2'-5' RNA ligase